MIENQVERSALYNGLYKQIWQATLSRFGKKCLYERVARAKQTKFIIFKGPRRGRLSILCATFSVSIFRKMEKLKNSLKYISYLSTPRVI